MAIEQYWNSDDLTKAVQYKEDILKNRLLKIAAKYPEYTIDVRGRGLAYGFEIKDDYSIASEVSAKAFERKLVIETAGSEGQVVKFLPPLLIDEATLNEGIDKFEAALEAVFAEKKERLTKEY